MFTVIFFTFKSNFPILTTFEILLNQIGTTESSL